MTGGIYTTNQSKTLESLADVDFTNLQNNEAPVYDATQEIFVNQEILTPSSLPSGSSGDVIISDGAGGLDSTTKLNVDSSTGNITGQFVDIRSTEIKLGTSAGIGAGIDNVSIGWTSGLNAASNAISIGSGAGNDSGQFSTSIGTFALAKFDKSIVINSSGSPLLSTQTNSCHIAPIRSLAPSSMTNVVQYNTSTKELVSNENLNIYDITCNNIQNNGTLTNIAPASLYAGQLTVGVGGNKVVAGGGSNTLVVDMTNNRVGINVANPTEDLDIDGNIQLNSSGTSKIVFYDSNDAHEHAEIDATDDGANGGMLQLHTKVDGNNVTEKLRINNNGAIGIAGANYGNQFQLLQSNGSGSSPSWVDPPLSTVIVSARKNTDTNVTCNADTTTFNDVDGFTEEIDTHNAYNPSTGVFTAPRDGIYNVSYITNYNDGNDSTYFGFVANNIQVNRGSGFVIEMAQNMIDTQRGIQLSTIYSHYIVTLSTNDQVKCVAQFFSSGVSTVCTIRGHATTPRCTVQNIHSLN